MTALPLILTVFVACAVEAIEALTIVLAAGLTRESFATVKQIAEGTRRDAAIAVTDVTVGGSAETLEVGFALPAGAYATAVLREIMKPAAPAGEVAQET